MVCDLSGTVQVRKPESVWRAAPVGYRHVLITIDIQFYINVSLETIVPTPEAITEQCTHIHTVHSWHCLKISRETVRLDQQAHRQCQQRLGTTQEPPTLWEDPADWAPPTASGNGEGWRKAHNTSNTPHKKYWQVHKMIPVLGRCRYVHMYVRTYYDL